MIPKVDKGIATRHRKPPTLHEPQFLFYKRMLFKVVVQKRGIRGGEVVFGCVYKTIGFFRRSNHKAKAHKTKHATSVLIEAVLGAALVCIT